MSEETNILDLLNNASETGFEELALVEPSTYKLELDANPTKNGQGVFVKGRIQDGPYAGQLIACGSLTFNEKATGIALQNLKGCGITRDDLNAIAAVNPSSKAHLCERVAAWLKGRVVEAKIIYNDYNGEVRNQFDIGKITLISAPANPGYGAGVPQAAPAPAAAAPAPTPETPAPAAAAPAAAPAAAEPVAAVAADASDPGF